MKRIRLFLLAALIIVCLIPVLLALVWFAMRGNVKRFNAIALPLDCSGNGAMNGDYRETISSRAGRKWPRFAKFINWLFADPNHCKGAVRFTQAELSRPLDT
jgi:hypothetical protein